MTYVPSRSLCLAAALTSPAAVAQSPRVLDFVVQTAQTDPAGRAFADFARTVEAQTRGGVRVRLRFQSSDVLSRAVKLGQVTGALVLRENLDTLCPTVAAFGVPSLFPNPAVMDRIFATMRPEFESACAPQITVLGWTLPGPRYIFLRSPVEPNAEGQLRGVGLLDLSPLQRRLLAVQPESGSGAVTPTGAPLIAGIVAAPGERGFHLSFRYVAAAPAGMDLGALVVNTAAFNALTSDQQRVVRSAAASTVQALSRTLRTVSPGDSPRIPESPAWTRWVQASRDRAEATPIVGPLFNRMRMMLGPVPPPQTTPSPVVTTPPPGDPPPSSTPTPTAPTAPTEPTTPATPTTPTTPNEPPSGPAVDLPFANIPPALTAIGYPRAASAMRSRLMRCYEPALRAPTPISGQITLSLRVLPNGTVAGVRTLNGPGLTTITDLVLTRCVESVVRSLRVPGLEADAVAVQQPVVFRAR